MGLSGTYFLIAICDECGVESVVRANSGENAWGKLKRHGWQQRTMFGKSVEQLYCPPCAQKQPLARKMHLKLVKGGE